MRPFAGWRKLDEHVPLARVQGSNPVKSVAVAFIFVGLGLGAAIADESCKAQANDNKFRGSEFKSFMENCETLAEMACNDQAIDKRLSDEDKGAFIKKCVKDAVGK
jgi:hypothetical protein